MINYKIISICIFFFISACNGNNKYEHILLPSKYKLTLIKETERGITDIYIYKSNVPINFSEIKDFPINYDTKKKEVIKWHLPTKKEIENILFFLKEEQKGLSINKRIISSLLEKRCYIAFIHNKNNSSIRNEDYLPYFWMDLFIIIDNNKIICFRYGKF